MRICIFYIESLDITRRQREKRSSGKRKFDDKNSRFGINDRGEISPCYMHSELGVSRAWLTQFREMMPGSVTAFATHNTVGNSPLPQLTMLLLGQYAPSRAGESGPALRHRSRKRFVIVNAALLLPAHESFSKALFCWAASAREAGANVNRRRINTLSRPSYIMKFRSVGPGRHDPFGAIRLNTSAPLCFLYYHFHLFW